MNFVLVRRGGEYFRVADPDWVDPLDGTHSMQRGGRWNAPGSFPVVYLNAAVSTARANVLARLRNQPFAPEDLNPAAAPVLVTTNVASDDFVDVVTDAGCRAAGLPESYPRLNGAIIGHEVCQPIGRRAWDEGRRGIACRSAADGASEADEELAWFDRGTPLAPLRSQAFDEWFLV